jgi:leukotriene-A4 hydrolase
MNDLHQLPVAAFKVMSPPTIANMGQALVIELSANLTAGQSISIQVDYKTDASSNAMSWMTKAQTAGKVMPYMYSQCEDINCRSIVPVQDTPSNKVTYSARVETEKEFVVKMSANQTALNTISDTVSESYFLCEIPIANYLMAIAAGDIIY